MEKRYYLAYGSNLDVTQMRYRCPSARIIGTAEIKDYRLLFKGSKTGAYLTIEEMEGESVPVGVWEVSSEDELRLDRYEGFPSFYYKKELVLPIKGIKSGKVRTRKAFVYIMHEERPLGIPSKAYLQTCSFGYSDFGFDHEKLAEAYCTTLYSGSLSSGSIAFDFGSYKAYIIVGMPSASSSRMSIVIPQWAITTYEINWQIADESYYRSFRLFYSGSYAYLTIGGGSGYITDIYGVN